MTHTPSSDMDAFEKQARENVDLSPRRLEMFIKKGKALRHNLLLRKQQQAARRAKALTHVSQKENPCMLSK